MTSKTCLVTGASGGIGREVALGLARAGHRVILCGRDFGRTRDAAAAILAAIPGACLETRLADLSSMAQTLALGQAVLAAHPRLDLLVLNAGIFSATRRETSEGHERVLAVNHLAPFLLIRTLLPALLAVPGARIIAVGSSTSDRCRIDPADLELRAGWGFSRAYARSKLALMMTVFDWAERLRNENIACAVVHPGAVATGLVRARGPIGWAWHAMAPFLRGEAEGAAGVVWACLSDRVETGRYYKDRQVAAANPRARDPALRAAVWTATESSIGALPQTPSKAEPLKSKPY